MAINLDEIYRKQTPNSSNTTMNTPSNIVGSGVVGSGGVSVNAPSTTMQPDFSKYLYDSGLQNVFNDYQQNIALLNQQEQQQLQNAYTIREMSKKYLGEYASNVGIGDVSGNLLDIYSQYQQNVGDIAAQSDVMALNLQQAFQQQSEQAFQQALQKSLQEQQLQMDENAQNLFFQISRGDTGGVDWVTYLQNALDSGEIDQTQYNTLYSGVYTAKLDEFESNIARNFFGFKVASDGTRVPMTAQEYIQENKSWLSPQDYQRISDLVAYGEQQSDVTFERVLDRTTLNTNLQLFLPDDVGIYSINLEGETFYFAEMNVSVDDDNVSNAVSTTELMTAFKEENPNATLISGQTIYEYNGTYYVYKDEGTKGASWYRMYNTSDFYTGRMAEITDDIMKNWNKDNYSGKVLTNDYFTYDKEKNEITSKNGLVTWVREEEGRKFTNIDGDILASFDDDTKAIYDKFKEVFGEVKKYQVIVFNGTFYTINWRGNLEKFARKPTSNT